MRAVDRQGHNVRLPHRQLISDPKSRKVERVELALVHQYRVGTRRVHAELAGYRGAVKIEVAELRGGEIDVGERAPPPWSVNGPAVRSSKGRRRLSNETD